MLKEACKEIQVIDYTSVYSCFFIKNQEKRDKLVEKVKKIHIEIMYREDDEKRMKYDSIRKKDPMKNSMKKICMEYIMQK